MGPAIFKRRVVAKYGARRAICKKIRTVSNLAYIYKKARGRLTAPLLFLDFLALRHFFRVLTRRSLSGEPWEGGWADAGELRHPSELPPHSHV